MNIDFVFEDTHDVITTLEMVYPPMVNNVIGLYDSSKKYMDYRVTHVEFCQLEPERTSCTTRYGHIDCVGAICEVIPFEEGKKKACLSGIITVMSDVIAEYHKAFEEFNKEFGQEPDFLMTSPKNWSKLLAYTNSCVDEAFRPKEDFGQIATLWGVQVLLGMNLTVPFLTLKDREPIQESFCKQCYETNHKRFTFWQEGFLQRGYYPCFKKCSSYALPPEECPFILEHLLIG